jgi:hypothetical protein
MFFEDRVIKRESKEAQHVLGGGGVVDEQKVKVKIINIFPQNPRHITYNTEWCGGGGRSSSPPSPAHKTQNNMQR